MASQHIKFSAEKREQAGKGVARALRREGKIPAVIYGDNQPPVTITMSSKEAYVEYYKGHFFNTLSDITVDGEKFLTLARDIQVDPIKDHVLHIDFLRVSPKTRINVNIPVHFINEEEAAFNEEGGIFNIVRHEVEMVCKATNIPEYIEVDVSAMELAIGDAIKSTDIEWPEGAQPTIDDREFTIATIAAPKTAEEEEAEAEENAEDIESAGEEDEEGEEGSSEDGEGDSEEKSEES